MDREEAKIWASIPRKKLAVIASHLDKHFDLLCAYANDAEIQLKFRDKRDWHTLNSPDFNADEWAEYRVKPSKEEEQPKESWEPKKGVSVLEKVESLDGQELSYHEKNLIRLLRNVKIKEVYQFYSVFDKQGGGISFRVDDEESREKFYQTLTALAEKSLIYQSSADFEQERENETHEQS